MVDGSIFAVNTPAFACHLSVVQNNQQLPEGGTIPFTIQVAQNTYRCQHHHLVENLFFPTSFNKMLKSVFRWFFFYSKTPKCLLNQHCRIIFTLNSNWPAMEAYPLWHIDLWPLWWDNSYTIAEDFAASLSSWVLLPNGIWMCWTQNAKSQVSQNKPVDSLP